MRDHPWHNSIRHVNIFSILSSINIYPLLYTVLKTSRVARLIIMSAMNMDMLLHVLMMIWVWRAVNLLRGMKVTSWKEGSGAGCVGCGSLNLWWLLRSIKGKYLFIIYTISSLCPFWCKYWHKCVIPSNGLHWK